MLATLKKEFPKYADIPFDNYLGKKLNDHDREELITIIEKYIISEALRFERQFADIEQDKEKVKQQIFATKKINKFQVFIKIILSVFYKNDYAFLSDKVLIIKMDKDQLSYLSTLVYNLLGKTNN